MRLGRVRGKVKEMGFKGYFKGCFVGSEFDIREFVPSFREGVQRESFHLFGPGLWNKDVICISEGEVVVSFLVCLPCVV